MGGGKGRFGRGLPVVEEDGDVMLKPLAEIGKRQNSKRVERWNRILVVDNICEKVRMGLGIRRIGSLMNSPES